MMSITTALLTARGKPTWTFLLTAPMLPMAVLGDWLVVPRFGAIGAASVQTVVAWTGALATIFAVHRLWNFWPRISTLIRSLALAACAWALTAIWPTAGIWLAVKLLAVSAAVTAALVVLGEFSAVELAFGRSLVRWPFASRKGVGEAG